MYSIWKYVSGRGAWAQVSPSPAITAHNAGLNRCTSAAPRTYGPHKTVSVRLGQKLKENIQITLHSCRPATFLFGAYFRSHFDWPCCNEFNCIRFFLFICLAFRYPIFFLQFESSQGHSMTQSFRECPKIWCNCVIWTFNTVAMLASMKKERTATIQMATQQMLLWKIFH